MTQPKESPAFQRGRRDAYQDRCENTPCASIGGLDSRLRPERPPWIDRADWREYLAGYEAQCRSMWGADWQTCEFGWKPVLTMRKSA